MNINKDDREFFGIIKNRASNESTPIINVLICGWDLYIAQRSPTFLCGFSK